MLKAGRQNEPFIFTFETKKDIQATHGAETALSNKIMRQWGYLAVDQGYQGEFVTRDQFQLLDEITFKVELYSKNDRDNKTLDTALMYEPLRKKFADYKYAVVKDQPFVLKYENISVLLHVGELPDAKVYRVDASTKITFESGPNSALILSGKYKSKTMRSNIINPNFNFNELGIGGLDEEFKEIFRRAFASRNLAPDIIEKMAIKHVKGILLHGPPGCGKTLTARQIGKMLSAREPKIVNGPEILNKFVGESESNIRKLFEDAEEEQKRLGSNSGLHIIIFDEIDAICKQRGSVTSASGVHDTVVNQLLSKIDGVEPLNNILVIGMTNRPDLIDEALLRPGRLEVKKEIGLPDENGRYEVLKIHTKKMTESKTMSEDVNLRNIAELTKNFSGAELAGLVRGAQSCAIVRHVKLGKKVEYDDQTDDIKVTMLDFMASLENDIKPAYGSKEEDFEKYMRNGILIWDAMIQDILDNGELFNKQVRNSSKTPLMSMLLTGDSGCGKTALAVQIAVNSAIPFIKILSPLSMVGYSEHGKVQHIKKVFDDAFRSEISCIVIDNIERLIEYNPMGNRYSNSVAQTLTNLLECQPPLNKRLLIIATSGAKDLLENMQMTKIFSAHYHVPCMTTQVQVMSVINEIDSNLTPSDKSNISNEINKLDAGIMIGIKHLIQVIATTEQTTDQSKTLTFIQALHDNSRLRHS